MMSSTAVIFRREFFSYFETPIATVFLMIFLVMQGLFTFYLGAFYTREQADLTAFFTFHPWLYLFFMPAIAMRLWAEERRSGTLELLLTLPLPRGSIVFGKYLASVAFAALALLLTFPIWITVNWLGDPDNGVIITGYLGSLLMAAAYLSIGAAVSVMTKNQVIACIMSVSICFLFLVAGLPMVLDFMQAVLPDALVITLANLSFLSHFDNLQKGVVALGDVVFFLAVIALWLMINLIMLDSKREAG